MNRRHFLAGMSPSILGMRSGSAADRPNIVWILGDDLGCELGCYGYPGVRTPNIDRLADESVRFTQHHTTAPVCSASRSAFNVGLYQTTTGTHRHRSHRKDGYELPKPAKLITERFREAGYFTANVREFAPGVAGNGKTDFNFRAEHPFDGTHWNQRAKGQPFYAQVNFSAPHKGAAFKEARQQERLIDPEKVMLPPYYPDHPVVRNEMANYLDAVQLLDTKIGVLVDTLRRDGLLDNTVLFLFGDNGRCLLRGKQWLYDFGTHVPLLVRWPGVAKAGSVRDEPCISLDLNATSLAAAEIPIPEGYHGRPLFGTEAKRREHIFTARDRCDMTVDRIRAVRDGRYKYIRNYMPERPYAQYNRYIAEEYPTLRVIQERHTAGKLNSVQSLWMAPQKPPAELYDTVRDPFEVVNLAGRPEQAGREKRMAQLLDQWVKETGDKGEIPESPEDYQREAV